MLNSRFMRRLVLLTSIAVLTAPLVYAGIADIDLSGATRASPPTMGALEVGSTQSGLPPPPTGIVLTRIVQ
mgnify:CR=1 FL=1